MDNEKNDNFYCNQIQIACTPWDIILSMQRLGLVVDETGLPTGKVKPADEIQVAMSLSHAKLMVAALYQQITGYEQDVIKGKIPLDPENQKVFDKFIASVKAST